jgi:gas vesicle protein
MAKGLLTGAALGTLIGSVAAALYPKRKEIIKAIQDESEYLSRKAHDVADSMPRFRREPPRSNLFIAGSLFGLFVGAGAALLLAPKTGKGLRNQIARKYNEINDKTHEIIDLVQHNAEPYIFNGHHHGKQTRKKSHTSKR